MIYLAWCAAVDFYFALLPWIFIWNLNMKFKEKMSIAISLSLGFMCAVLVFPSPKIFINSIALQSLRLRDCSNN